MTTSALDNSPKSAIGTHTDGHRPRTGVPLFTLAVAVGYLAVGLTAFWSGLRHFSTAGLIHEADYRQSEWFIAWVPHALAHGLNPFFSKAIFAPAGINLAVNTSSPLLGLFTIPFSPFLSTVARVNLIMVLSMPLSAMAGFIVLRRWQVWPAAAAIGGLLYGFSPYMVGQSSAHIDLLFAPFPPFIALTIVSILEHRGPAWRNGIQLGLLAVAQYLVAPEVFTTVAVLALAAVVLVAVLSPRAVPELLRRAARPMGIAAIIVSCLLAYPIWMLTSGSQHVKGAPFPASNPFHSDLLSFVVPSLLQRVSFGLRSIPIRNPPHPVEAGAYIGIPLLVISAFLAYRSRRSRRMQLAVAILLGSALLSLGPRLTVAGHLTKIPLPFAVFDHLPLLSSILPTRITFEENLALAALLAFGLDDMRRPFLRLHQRPRHSLRVVRRRSQAFALLTVVVLLVTQFPQWPNGPGTAEALPIAIRQAIPPGDPVVLTYPFATGPYPQPMVWQMVDGFKFQLLGGYGYHPGANGAPRLNPNQMDPAGLQEFLTTQQGPSPDGPPQRVGPALVATTKVTMAKYDIKAIVVDRSIVGSAPVVTLFEDTLGPPGVTSGEFLLWTPGESASQSRST
jgi:hypothetical protein